MAAEQDIKEYIWDGEGDFSRRENGKLYHYVKGDKVKLSPRTAYNVRGQIKTLGGVLIPANMFDSETHPRVEKPKPSSPQEREAEQSSASPSEESKSEPKPEPKSSGGENTGTGTGSKSGGSGKSGGGS